MKFRQVAALLFFSLLPISVADARIVDPALVGTWFIPMGDTRQEQTLLWRITRTGESSMVGIIKESGLLVADLESWTVQSSESPYRLLTGTYQMTGRKTLSTVMPRLSPEWITWTRMVPGNTPPGMEACIASDLLNEAAPETPQSTFNPAMIGLWHASTVKEDGIEMVWRINPNGQSIFVAITRVPPSSLEAYDGYFKIMSGDDREHEGTYQFLNTDAFEMTEGATTDKWIRCGAGDAVQR